MLKWLTQWRETRKQHKAPSSASVRSILKTAVADAEQIVASIRMKAQAEAEEEVARIIAQANQEAEEIRRRIEAAVEKGVEDIIPVANRKTEITEVRAGEEVGAEKVEEPAQEFSEEKIEEPVQIRDEAAEEKVEETIVSELVAAIVTEEPLEQHLPEGKPDTAKIKPGLPKKDSLYTGEVELAIAKPLNPKMVSKLYNYLQTTPEIKFAHTSGSWARGTTITVVLDKPIPLISVLSSKIPEAEITPERPGEDGFVGGKRGLRRIKLALKEV